MFKKIDCVMIRVDDQDPFVTVICLLDLTSGRRPSYIG